MSDLLEIAMIVCFGLSWPFNVVRSWRARTNRGKSLFFLLFIFIGYLCGIAAKLLAGSFAWYVMFFYLLNTLMVGADLVLYVRNRRLDRQG